MKSYTLTINEDEAHAIGHALSNAIRANGIRRADGDHVAADLVKRLEATYRKLDTCPEVVEPITPTVADPAPESAQIEQLKLEVNRLVWQNSPASTTLGAAEHLAVKIVESILRGNWYACNNHNPNH